MSTNHKLRLGLGVMLVLVAVFAIVLAREGRVDAQTSAGQTGRYMMVSTPPAQSGSSYANFTWVLDTQTGAVTGYRFANVKDDKDQSLGWVAEKLTTVSAGLPKSQ